MRQLNFLLLFIFFCNSVFAGRYELDLTEHSWRIWIDSKAEWKSDQLYLPPYNFSEMPANKPTIGWTKLYSRTAIETKLPTSIDKYVSNDSINQSYKGVSWVYTIFKSPFDLKDKHVELYIGGASYRAEVFLNGKLVSYSLLFDAPFSSDISGMLQPGEYNTLAIRLTNPCNAYANQKMEPIRWGDHALEPSNGFSGISGKVKVLVTEKTFIRDIFVQNTPDVAFANIDVTMESKKQNGTAGRLRLDISEKSNPGNIVYSMYRTVNMTKDKGIVHFPLNLAKFKWWHPDAPNLYLVKAAFEVDNDTEDEVDQTFGLRFFGTKERGNQQSFYFNRQRFYMAAANSSGFWHHKGLPPSNANVEKEVTVARKIGLNTLYTPHNFNMSNFLDIYDKEGMLLTLKLPHYSVEEEDLFYKKHRFLRLKSIIKKYRNHPSLIMLSFNRNPEFNNPDEIKKELKTLQKEDGSRLLYSASAHPKTRELSFNNGYISNALDTNVYSLKWKINSYKDSIYNIGNTMYSSLDSFIFNRKQSGIVFNQLIGSYGLPTITGKTQETYNKVAPENKAGFYYSKLLKHQQNELKAIGFNQDFPNADVLNTLFNNVWIYNQAQALENSRINNTSDGFFISAWEACPDSPTAKLVNEFRNVSGDPKKISNTAGYSSVVIKGKSYVFNLVKPLPFDFHLINTLNINGRHNLQIEIIQNKEVVYKENTKVKVSGGEQYGELLKEQVLLSAAKPGYGTIRASLLKGKDVISVGERAFYAIQPEDSCTHFYTIDSTFSVHQLVDKMGMLNYLVEQSSLDEIPDSSLLILGNLDLYGDSIVGHTFVPEVLDWVARGNTLFLPVDDKNWVSYLEKVGILEHVNHSEESKGKFFNAFVAKKHPIFNALPQKQPLGWEYQFLSSPSLPKHGFKVNNVETLLAYYDGKQKGYYSSIFVINMGAGSIIISAVDFNRMVSEYGNGSPALKQLFHNIIEFGATF